MDVKTLDHIALWVEDRDLIADFATRHLGMHVIERTEKFTLIGSDARRGKLTLFAETGPRERGALKHVALRVARPLGCRRGAPGRGGDRRRRLGLRRHLGGSSDRARGGAD